jgi:hypothetical protein
MTLTLTHVPAPELDLATVPRRVDRVTGAKLVTLHYFPTSPRSLENWELNWLVVNGKATCETEALFAAAQAKLDAARRVAEPKARNV